MFLERSFLFLLLQISRRELYIWYTERPSVVPNKQDSEVVQ